MNGSMSEYNWISFKSLFVSAWMNEWMIQIVYELSGSESESQWMTDS